MDSTTDVRTAPRFLQGGGEMGERMRGFDWADHPLGPPTTWPAALQGMVGACLNSPLLGTILWGPSLLMLYNDGYIPSMADRHPAALGRPVAEVWGEAWEAVAEDFHRTMASGEGFIRNAVPLDFMRDGARVRTFWDFTATPIFDEHGAIGGLLNQGMETTAQVIALRKLEHERAALSRLFEQAPSFMALLEGPDLRFSLANRAYHHLVGREHLLGRRVDEALPEAVAQGYVGLLETVLRTGVAHRGTGARFEVGEADVGHTGHYLDFIYQPIVDSDGAITGVFVEVHDFTARVEHEQRLRDHQQALVALNESLELRVAQQAQLRHTLWTQSADLMAVTDRDGVVLAVNPAVARLLDCRTPLAFHDLLGPEASVFYTATPSDGAHRWDVTLVGDPEPLHLMWSAVIGASEVILVGRDMSREHAAEAALANANEQLRQAQKMEAIGQLTGGLAHDFNNLLTSMTGAVDIIRQDVDAGRSDRLVRCLATIEASTQRAAAITHRLLAFGRRQPLNARATDLEAIITGLGELLAHTMGPHMSLQLQLASAAWPVLVDPNQLENALINLCLNARDAMPEGGTLSISTQQASISDVRWNVPLGQYMAVAVSDTGFGMTDQVQARVFEPFYTTKPAGRGTGLGLSMVFGFVHQIGGGARIDSQLGTGTTVTLLLPRAPAPTTEQMPIMARKAGAPRGEGTVLLVDDEEGVRMVVEEALAETGYHVITASRGAEALQRLEESARIDLLVTDVGLPGGMKGLQLAALVQQRYPHIPVLFITGYAEDDSFLDGRDAGAREVLTKPFGMTTLLERIDTLMQAQLPGRD